MVGWSVVRVKVGITEGRRASPIWVVMAREVSWRQPTKEGRNRCSLPRVWAWAVTTRVSTVMMNREEVVQPMLKSVEKSSCSCVNHCLLLTVSSQSGIGMLSC